MLWWFEEIDVNKWLVSNGETNFYLTNEYEAVELVGELNRYVLQERIGMH